MSGWHRTAQAPWVFSTDCLWMCGCTLTSLMSKIRTCICQSPGPRWWLVIHGRLNETGCRALRSQLCPLLLAATRTCSKQVATLDSLTPQLWRGLIAPCRCRITKLIVAVVANCFVNQPSVLTVSWTAHKNLYNATFYCSLSEISAETFLDN